MKFMDERAVDRAAASLPAWGAWVEILPRSKGHRPPRRSPHGERGLKFRSDPQVTSSGPSLPAWGAWVEIACCTSSGSPRTSLPAWGAWVEIASDQRASLKRCGRSLHGERGLKSVSYRFSNVDLILFMVCSPSLLVLRLRGGCRGCGNTSGLLGAISVCLSAFRLAPFFLLSCHIDVQAVQAL